MRDIASAVHMSFSDIKKITKRLDGDIGTDLSNKSKATQAIFLFKSGKKPIDVTIELDISANEIEDILQEYWVLNHLDLFLKLFHTLKKNKSKTYSQRHIQTMIRYAVFDLPSLENKIQRLTRDVIDMEWRKKHLRDEVAKLNSNKSQLEKLQKRYQMDIGLKKEIISNLNQQLNQKSYALETAQAP